MESKTIQIPMYQTSFTILLDDDMKEIVKMYKLRGDAVRYHALTFTKDRGGYNHYYVAFPRHVNHGVIVHECIHLCNFIFNDCSIGLDIVNDENQAYFTQWLFNECLKFLNNKLNNNNESKLPKIKRACGNPELC